MPAATTGSWSFLIKLSTVLRFIRPLKILTGQRRLAVAALLPRAFTNTKTLALISTAARGPMMFIISASVRGIRLT